MNPKYYVVFVVIKEAEIDQMLKFTCQRVQYLKTVLKSGSYVCV